MATFTNLWIGQPQTRESNGVLWENISLVIGIDGHDIAASTGRKLNANGTASKKFGMPIPRATEKHPCLMSGKNYTDIAVLDGDKVAVISRADFEEGVIEAFKKFEILEALWMPEATSKEISKISLASMGAPAVATTTQNQTPADIEMHI